jgi:predicted metal-binding membrane protein
MEREYSRVVALPAFLAMWSAGMAAMMLPSELPLFRLDYATAGSRPRTAVLGAGYLAVWLAIAGPVWLLDMALGGAVLGMHGRIATAVVLGAAALYQLTPLKRRCLNICRAPLARVVHGWRDGVGGAFRMGVENGLWCVGCCIGLTAALLALGMMDLWWMVVAGVAIFAEKATRAGIVASRLGALALATGGVLWTI